MVTEPAGFTAHITCTGPTRKKIEAPILGLSPVAETESGNCLQGHLQGDRHDQRGMVFLLGVLHPKVTRVHHLG